LIVLGLVCWFTLRQRRRSLAPTAGNVKGEEKRTPELDNVERNKPEHSGKGLREMEAFPLGAKLVAGSEHTELEAGSSTLNLGRRRLSQTLGLSGICT